MLCPYKINIIKIKLISFEKIRENKPFEEKSLV